MTIIPSIVSALFSILLWPYMRHNLKRNLVNFFQINHLWLYGFDFIFVFCAFFRFIYRIQNPYLNNSSFYFLINLSYVLLGFLGACHHCHIKADPNRTEIMTEKTIDRLIELMSQSPNLKTIDITGGALT